MYQKTAKDLAWDKERAKLKSECSKLNEQLTETTIAKNKEIAEYIKHYNKDASAVELMGKLSKGYF